MMAAVFRLSLLFGLVVLTVAQNQIRITSPAPQGGSQTRKDISNCQPLAARKATFTNPANVFYTGKPSAFRYTVNTVLQGPIDLSVVKFPAVTNNTITPPTPDKPNPITFPRNDSLNALTTGARNFELIFTEDMKCHPCMLQLSVATTGGTYYHCTDIGVFSRLDDWIVQLVVQKAPAEAVLLPNTFLNKLIQSYPGQGFSANTVQVPDTAFPVDSSNSQYTITFHLIDNPDRTSTEMAANFQNGAQDAGTRLQLNVVGLSLTRPSQPSDPGTDNTGVVIAVVVIILAIAIGGGAFAWYRHRTTNGQPICCCAPKSVAGRRV